MMNFKSGFHINSVLAIIFLLILSISCRTKNDNPLLEPFNTLHEVPPIELLKPEHFKEAFDIALIESRSAIDDIINNSKKITFKNTVAAIEFSNEKLQNIRSILYFANISSSNTQMIEVYNEINKKYNELEYELLHNQILYQKIKYVYDNRHKLGLNPEEIKLTENQYYSRVKNGISLSKEKQERLLLIDEKLSKLSHRFHYNVIQDTENWFLHIKDSADLAGLPKTVIDNAKKDAINKQLDGWVFPTSSYGDNSFTYNADNRELREKYYKAYAKIGANQNEFNNEKIVLNIVNLRLEKANLLGYDTYADYVLSESMARDKENVKRFIESQQSNLLPLAINEYKELNTFAHSIGFKYAIEPWDWHYFSQKLKTQKFNFDDAHIKEYFPYNQVEKGIFGLLERLWGLKFVLNKNIPVYHPDVRPFEVYEENGDLLGILLLDLFEREGKETMGWMSLHRPQQMKKGKRIIPIVGISDSYLKFESDSPALLSMANIQSFLHEFGHALHGLFSEVTYRSLSGTNVDRDFVEFPSMFMEQWTYEKSFIESIAFHFETGKKMPSELMDLLISSNNYHKAHHKLNINRLNLTDYAWHSITNQINMPVTAFEEKVLPRNLYDFQSERNLSTSLSYIFSYGYASFLYSYDWCEMIAKDAFKHFRENGLYNRKIANDLRVLVLSKGGTEHPMALYKRFRGMEPEFNLRSNIIK